MQIINSDILKKFYNHKNKVAQMLSEDEKYVLEYFLRSEVVVFILINSQKMDYLYENDAGNPKYTEYNRLFCMKLDLELKLQQSTVDNIVV